MAKWLGSDLSKGKKGRYDGGMFFQKQALDAVCWKLIAAFCFAVMNYGVRWVSFHPAQTAPLPVYVIDFFQNLTGLCILGPWLLRRRGLWQLPPTPVVRRFHHLRIFIALLAIGAWYKALQTPQLKIPQAMAFQLVSPLVTLLGAWLFLGEPYHFLRVTSALLSIAGGFLLSRPDQLFLLQDPLRALESIGWPLLAVVGFCGVNLLNRYLGRRGVSAEGLTWSLLLGLTPYSLLVGSAHWIWPMGPQWGILAGLGLLNFVAHYALCRAYQSAEVSFLFPIGILKYGFAACMGLLFFEEHWRFGFDKLAGIACVLCSGWLLFLECRGQTLVKVRHGL